MKEIAEGYLPHVLDAAEILVESGTHVSQEKILNCWEHANCLPVPMQAEWRIEGSGALAGDFDLGEDLKRLTLREDKPIAT